MSVSKIELSWKLKQEKVPVNTIVRTLKLHRATLYRWWKGIKRLGIREFIRRYKRAKQRKRMIRIDYRTESLLIEKRRGTTTCGQKLKWWLDRVHGIKVSVATIYRILGKHFTLHSKWQKWTRRPPVPKATFAREVIQTDNVELGGLIAYTFIDTYTREAYVWIGTDKTSNSAITALHQAFIFFGGTVWLQTDNGGEYKRNFPRQAKHYSQHLRRITPYQKEENGFIESFNRTLRNECVGWRYYQPNEQAKLQERVSKWLDEYHTERPHLSLNLQTPQEFVLSLNS